MHDRRVERQVDPAIEVAHLPVAPVQGRGRLVVLDYEAGTLAFSNVPAWVVELILPFGFGVIALRYLFLCTAAVNRFIAYTRRT